MSQRAGILTNAKKSCVVNDGSGADVSIPSFSLYKNIADKIKKELKKDQSVLLNSRVSERLRQFAVQGKQM
jgi:hypothetical protein